MQKLDLDALRARMHEKAVKKAVAYYKKKHQKPRLTSLAKGV
ncbi:hypothetical protein JCM19237_4257 [Photobacterium aphoticum]|uniref:Uncharacterized protein n=1 Tax=Photobacterium aphoticum TaxID=754436 RepID=A0A090QPQ3_9GAMM|nr:hypothetical protein JCM19237_4257 [Photobacterium aphoticum]